MNLMARLTRLEQHAPRPQQADNPFRHMTTPELEQVAQQLYEREGGSGEHLNAPISARKPLKIQR